MVSLPISRAPVRFTAAEIERQWELTWWNWPVERIGAVMAILAARDVEALGRHAP